jgi:glycosyltransferase involved in cell wall biosynthesis
VPHPLERKFIFVTRKWPPAVGGMETYCWELTQRLADHGALKVIALPGQANGAPPGAAARIGFGLTAAMRLACSRGGDVVHAGDVASWPLAWIASLRHPQSRIIVSAHGSDLSYAKRRGWRARLYDAYLRFGARRLRKATVIANSRWIAGLARDAGWRRVVTIPLATAHARGEFAPDHGNALLFAGRIMRSKGLSFIVNEVLPLLPDEVCVRIAGTVWEASEGRVLDHPRVDYLGRLNEDELAAEYRSALCTVVPSLTPEGFGLAAVEAAVAGGVVVASDHSGLQESVLPDTGFLVEAGNATEWARQIRKISGWSEKEREEFVRRSSAAASEGFSWSRVVKDTLSVYDGEPPEAA